MNTLYLGDNLDVLRKHVFDESVDLVYLDPPFNSKRDYNVILQGSYRRAARLADARVRKSGTVTRRKPINAELEFQTRGQ